MDSLKYKRKSAVSDEFHFLKYNLYTTKVMDRYNSAGGTFRLDPYIRHWFKDSNLPRQNSRFIRPFKIRRICDRICVRETFALLRKAKEDRFAKDADDFIASMQSDGWDF